MIIVFETQDIWYTDNFLIRMASILVEIEIMSNEKINVIALNMVNCTLCGIFFINTITPWLKGFPRYNYSKSSFQNSN